MVELDKSEPAISGMFSRIAGRYDFLNHLLSANADRRWRKRAAAALNGRHRRVLDVATGTGDLALSIGRNGRQVFGADFCLDMLVLARQKTGRRRDANPVAFSAADALVLPFADASFDAVTVGFGVRNFADLSCGLIEMRRVLKPGGTLLVLEFSQPRGLWGGVYRLYAGHVLPWIGGLLSGSREAYAYLHRSTRAWPEKEEFSRILARSGFSGVAVTPLSLGIVALHQAEKR
jgi:demethylmenaquinone methyltransferase / 2-methoxy-6-polyprenyl-1,4-benzoquinol methylase